MILKFVFLVILILLDFIIYLLPIYTLSLIINFILTLIWYLPSIYQLYSFIFTTKEYDLRIKIYLLLFFSPIIIALYIPLFIIHSVGYGIFFSLINPLITIVQRHEYPLSSLSLMAAIVQLSYKYIFSYSIEEILIDSLIIGRIKEVVHFTKHYWRFHFVKFPEKIKQCKPLFFTSIFLLDWIIILSIFIVIIVPQIFTITFLGIIFLSPIIVVPFYLEWLLMENIDYQNGQYIKFIQSALLLIVSIIILIIISPLIIFYLYLYFSSVVIRIFFRVIEFYEENDDGFYNVMDFLLIIILIPLFILKIDRLAYIFCGIYMKFDHCHDLDDAMSPHIEFRCGSHLNSI